MAIIGETGNGDYGHWLDQAFVGVEVAEIVALAGSDEAGRKTHMEITGAMRGYVDYHEMLKTEKPDIAVIAPHELNIYLPMVLAAAEQGSHVYFEKPLAATVGVVDASKSMAPRALSFFLARPGTGRTFITTPIPTRPFPEMVSGRRCRTAPSPPGKNGSTPTAARPAP